ncbi:hypothetical protein F5J12DRAFT_779148 [Pisolithus orientalis]|uniref:uncharacterized protein n=1 Tax=Pisolithus orientalis TaxID=936130 RepID=UPI0022256C70|nr:uncharacterized protein F5J12DRAFT_779148 [Pisolithus orientalis]KAI6032699.1 hypothetical protein F5J12DRAFT_779148 [Pisolithus orientalis]
MEQQQYNSGGESLITDQSLQSDQGTVDQGQVYYGQQDVNAGFISGEQHSHESGQYQGNSGGLLYSSESGQYQDNSGGLPYSSGFGRYQDNSGGLLYSSESGQNQENSGGLLYYSESVWLILPYQDNIRTMGVYHITLSLAHTKLNPVLEEVSIIMVPNSKALVSLVQGSGLQRIMSMTLPPTLEHVSHWLPTEGHDNQYIMDGWSNHPENISGEYPQGFYPPFHMVPGDSGTQHTGESTGETGGWKKNEGEAGWTFHPPPPGSYVDHATLKIPYEGEYIPPQSVIDDQAWAQLTGAPHWEILMGDRLVAGTTPLISFAWPAEARDHPHSRHNLNWPNSEKFGRIDIPKGEQTAMAHAVLEGQSKFTSFQEDSLTLVSQPNYLQEKGRIPGFKWHQIVKSILGMLLQSHMHGVTELSMVLQLISHVVYSLQWVLELDMDKGNNLKHYMSKHGNSAVDRGNPDSEAATLERYADLELGIGDAFLDHQWALMNKTHWYQVMKQIQNALCPV